MITAKVLVFFTLDQLVLIGNDLLTRRIHEHRLSKFDSLIEEITHE